MELNLKEAIYTRRSVRQFLDAEVEDEKLNLLLDAAVQAPSAMNSQPWVFGIIKQPEVLREYSDRAKQFLLNNLEKYPVFKKYKRVFEKSKFNIFFDAGCLVIIYAKPVHPGVEADCCLAAQNFMLAARALDLGTCWIGFSHLFLNTPEMLEELEVPPGYKAVAPIVVGYPKKPSSPVLKNKPEIIFRRG